VVDLHTNRSTQAHLGKSFSATVRLGQWERLLTQTADYFLTDLVREYLPSQAHRQPKIWNHGMSFLTVVALVTTAAGSNYVSNSEIFPSTAPDAGDSNADFKDATSREQIIAKSPNYIVWSRCGECTRRLQNHSTHLLVYGRSVMRQPCQLHRYQNRIF